MKKFIFVIVLEITIFAKVFKKPGLRGPQGFPILLSVNYDRQKVG